MLEFESLDDLTCRPDTPIREVLVRLNATKHVFQVVIDEAGKPLGTITDGDVRRAMLRGTDLDGVASQCMAHPPVLGHEGDDQENRRRMARIGMAMPFLPLVNGSGVLTRILVAADPAARVRTALVMAGGFGKRLGARTQSVPKPLLEIGGTPILERILRSLEAAGVTEIYVSVHYLADAIQAFIERRRNRASIALVPEDRPLGTIGALGLLPDAARQETLFVVNGDVLTQLDLSAVGTFHFRHDHDGTIVVQRHVVDIPYGVVRVDDHGLFAGIDEKPRIVNHVAGGIYLLSPRFIGCLTPGDPLDMPQLLGRGRDAGLRIGLFPLHEYWVDIGRPDDLARADADYEALDD